MSNKASILLLFFTLLFVRNISAQEIWSLEKCLRYAAENSLLVKQSELNIRSALVTEKQSKMARLPSLDASVSGGVQFGRTIDPTTNSFDNQTIGFNRYSLSAGVVLFNGNSINNTIERSKLNTEIARLDAEASEDNLYLSVATAYLNILMAEEQLENSGNQKRLSEEQLEQIDKLIKSGLRPENDRLNILAQIALNDQALVQSRNAVDLAYLQLKNLLQLDPLFDMKIEKPDLQVPAATEAEAVNFQTVYASALQTQPQIQAADLRGESADVGVKIARSSFFPTLSAFGSLSSNWSSVSKKVDGYTTVAIPQDVRINGVTTTVEFFSTLPNLVDDPFFDQINENFGQSVGLNLNIPIYNNHRNWANSEIAQINALNAPLPAEQTRQQLKNDVQSAVANARAARKSYEAAQKSRDAAKGAFDNAEKRFQLGAINTFEYSTAKINLDNAQTELVRAKYDLLFRLKIVDFYLGKELKF